MSRPFSLIICTYMRHKALLALLDSVKQQTLYPDEIIVVDGSTNNETQRSLELNSFKNLSYFKVGAKNRGLTKQRNFGINKLSKHTEIVCFLDDDTELERDYFEILIDTYDKKPEAIAVGGYIINEVKWKPTQESSSSKTFCFDGWERDEPLRFRLRKPLGLLPMYHRDFYQAFPTEGQWAFCRLREKFMRSSRLWAVRYPVKKRCSIIWGSLPTLKVMAFTKMPIFVCAWPKQENCMLIPWLG